MICSAFSTLALVSNENLASTSVDTLPGTIFKISLPNCVNKLSSVASTCSSMSLPCCLPYATASSMSLAYSGFLDAARIRDGLVVASCGLYLSMVAKSPESQTTVWFSVSMVGLRSLGKLEEQTSPRAPTQNGGATHCAGGFESVERVCHDYNRIRRVILVC
jgi:hypothetical protein